MKLKTIINFLRNRLVKSIFFTVSTAIMVLFMMLGSNILNTFELKTLDYRFSLRGTKKVASDVVVVFIGNKDIEDIGIWPWRRFYHALIIDALNRHGAKQIGFDILFTDISKKEFADDDLALAYSAASAGNVNIISFFGYFAEELGGDRGAQLAETDKAPAPKQLEKYSFDMPKGMEKYFRKATKHTLPIPALLGSVQGVGYADCLPDDDGVTRKLPMLVSYKSRLYMSFAFIMVSNYLGVTKDDIAINPGESIIITKGDKIYRIPINEKGEMIINYNHHLSDFKAYSYNQLLQSDQYPEMAIYDLKELAGKIAVIGTTYTGNTDLRPTPLDPTFPFLCLQATAIDNILEQEFVFRPNIFFRIMIILLFCAIISFLCSYTKPLVNSAVMVMLLVTYHYFAIFLFKSFNIWIDSIFPVIAILLPYIIMTTIHYIYALFENIKFLERMKFLGNLVESSHDAIFSFDLNGQIISWNSGAMQIYGYRPDEVLNKSWEIFIPPDKTESMAEIKKKAVGGGSTINFESVFIVKNGHKIPVNISISPIITAKGETSGVSIISQDLTERKRLMEQIMESEKLAEVGRLSAGLAHEMKNPLTPIIFYAQNMAESEELVLDDVHTQAKIIASEADRILKLATDLLSFSRPKDDTAKPVDLNKVVDETFLLIVYQARKLGAELQKNITDKIPKFKGEPDKIKQVLINLVMNSAHAMNGKKGTVTVATYPVSENGSDFVEMSVRDTGSGMTQDVKDNLFKPFFTTKGKGVGTGLGLYISYNIIKQHDGNVWVESEEGVGATFFLRFPAIKDS